jgi:alkane 1-monooxygenase
MRALKYLAAFSLPVFVVISFISHGWLTYLPLLYAFVFLPAMEYFIGEDNSNLNELQREMVRKDKVFDALLYLTVPTQILCLTWFLFDIKNGQNTGFDLGGKITAMGIMCGVFGINIAHELGHRTTNWEQFLAKIMLSTSLYMHFFIEHNRGHHRNVGTPEDAATARRNEMVYTFWFRTIVYSFLSAWNIVKKERQRKKLAVWSFGNEMIRYLTLEIVLSVAIGFAFGFMALCAFFCAALIGILLLEMVNYVEHYGLFRKKVSEFRYQDVEPQHSWNSDYILGRVVLFELTRHSDHHWEPSKKYPLLDTLPNASQLPAGYPAMILLSLIPPFWFKVMNPRLDRLK